MNYLYFDIECCDGVHMCSFGYVIANSKFEVIEKEDIMINPQWKFRKGRDGFDILKILGLTKNYFKKLPPFTHFYKRIKKLLTNDNYVLLGHDVNSDINYLKTACERYKLEEIKCEAYDTQNFYYQINNKYPSRSMHNIIDDLALETTLTEHISCNDAELSMLVTKEICSRLGFTLEELLDICEDSKRNGVKKSKNKTKSEFKMKLAELAHKYPNRYSCPAICLSDSIVENDVNGRLRLIERIFEKGYNYSTKVSESKFFVFGTKEGVRDKSCNSHLEAEDIDIKKISIDDLSNMLDSEINDFGEIEEEFNSELYEALKSSLDKKGLTYSQWKKSF